jgi:hypothetical protein
MHHRLNNKFIRPMKTWSKFKKYQKNNLFIFIKDNDDFIEEFSMDYALLFVCLLCFNLIGLCIYFLLVYMSCSQSVG